MQQVAADANRQRRQPAKHLDVAGIDRHFLLRLAKRRGFRRLARIDAPTRQRHLPCVVAQPRSAHRQRHVPPVITRIKQEQRRGRPEVRLGDARRRHALESGRHPQLRVESGQRSRQGAAQHVGQGGHRDDRTVPRLRWHAYRIRLCSRHTKPGEPRMFVDLAKTITGRVPTGGGGLVDRHADGIKRLYAATDEYAGLPALPDAIKKCLA